MSSVPAFVGRRQAVARGALLCCCLLAAADAALAGCGAAGHGRAARPVAGQLSRPPRFAVFSQTAASQEALPAEAAADLRQSAQPRFSAAGIGMAARVLPGNSAWLVPAANGEVCLVRIVYPQVATLRGQPVPPAVGRDCVPEAVAQQGRLLETQTLGGVLHGAVRSNVFGIVPDGVRAVAIVSRGGESQTVAVERNAYEALAVEPSAVRFVQRQGSRSWHRSVAVVSFNANSASPRPSKGQVG